MESYKTSMIRQRKWMFYLLSVLVLGWGFTSYQKVFLGLLLGSTFAFLNLWIIQRKALQLGQATTKKFSVNALGTFTRLSLGALAIVIALQYKDQFQFLSVAIGLMTTYFVILIDFMFQSYQTSTGKRGE